MPKSKRLMEIMLTVNRRKRFTVRQLADQFGVSSRTILRDLQELSELGVPLYSETGPHGGYQVINERVLPPIAFTEGEATAIFFASHALRHYSSLPFEADTVSALTKFYAFLPADVKDRIDQLKNRVDFNTPARNQHELALPLLLDAALNPKVLRIEYDSRKQRTVRDIQPIGIYASNGLWYCPAYCFTRGDYRKFRVDYIRSAQLAEPERPPLDLSNMHLNNWPDHNGEHLERVEVVVEVSRKGMRRCETELWPQPELTVREDGSGVVRANLPRSELSFFAEYFVGLGQDALVTAPVELVDMIKERLMKTLDRYSSVSS